MSKRCGDCVYWLPAGANRKRRKNTFAQAEAFHDEAKKRYEETREIITLKGQTKNEYIINGDVTYIVDADGNRAIIDTEDLEKVKPYYFRLYPSIRKFCACANGVMRYLAHVIIGRNQNEDKVYYKMPRLLDCRKSNLVRYMPGYMRSWASRGFRNNGKRF